ncbi:glycosyltransferase [Pseudoprimorskyibacter insulae]|uniref:Mycofactocin biosynthesis glycosyltransferase MftF n=1 Tax=Pseudoprimorskyibacter insulae TaxID=1695997 RepID=A0A2R8AUB7_9RHOB|nr:glycosyltransferase family 2 protein [Pseudoprimorskyibacter insulae]SPF79474.1 Putative mycofactocin biosynthesis glycosyltransferase MftF [Pseudoprimorskyibacter insulae]
MQVDVVLIGRNEGQRLVNALAAVQGQARRVVYVDSGSTDNSLAEAEKAGALIVNLDMTIPFTAARARNAGFQALADSDTPPELVQFIDGDCAVVDGYIAKAAAHLAADDGLGVVTGWRSEIYRDKTIYNQLCDFEWRRPAGPIDACGGDMMVRANAFEAVGGFDPTVIAAEDDEFCTRLRKAGWRLERIPQEMTRHDADMTSFGQWWQRAVRSGHGFAQVGHLHPDYFVRERRRVMLWGAILPFVALVGAFITWVIPALILGLYAVSYLRTAKGLGREGLPKSEAQRHAALLTLWKFPNLIGMARFHWRRLRRAQMRIIEYK